MEKGVSNLEDVSERDRGYNAAGGAAGGVLVSAVSEVVDRREKLPKAGLLQAWPRSASRKTASHHILQQGGEVAWREPAVPRGVTPELEHWRGGCGGGIW